MSKERTSSRISKQGSTMLDLSVQKNSHKPAKFPLHVLLANGVKEEFNQERIFEKIFRYGERTGERRTSQFARIADKIIYLIMERSNNSEIVSTDLISSCVEDVCSGEKHLRIARTFVAYRQNVSAKEKINNSIEYTGQIDALSHKNTYKNDNSFENFMANTTGKIIEKYWLTEVFNGDISELHCNSDIHIHDLNSLGAKDVNWSLGTILENDLGSNNAGIKIESPDCFSGALNHIVNALRALQTEWTGLQSLELFDVFLAPYVRKDQLSEEKIMQAMQGFIFNLNMTFGGSGDFNSAINLNLKCPENLSTKIPNIAGDNMPFCYGDLQREIALINKVFVRVMMAGDARGVSFQNPQVTYNIHSSFDWDSSASMEIYQLAINNDNITFNDATVSHIPSEEYPINGGAIGSVSINCARLGYIYQNDDVGLYKWLDELLDMATDSLIKKRNVLDQHLSSNSYPYTSGYLQDYSMLPGVVCLEGVNEMIRNFSQDDYDISSHFGKKFAMGFLDHVNYRLNEISKRSGDTFILESNPDEKFGELFAKEDSSFIHDIIHAGIKNKPNYTSSTELPAGFTDNPFEVLEHQNELQKKYSGRSLFKIFADGVSLDAGFFKLLLKQIITEYKIPCISIIPCFSLCSTHGYVTAKEENCPICNKLLLRINRIHNRSGASFDSLVQCENQASIIAKDMIEEKHQPMLSANKNSEVNKIIRKRRRSDFSNDDVY